MPSAASVAKGLPAPQAGRLGADRVTLQPRLNFGPDLILDDPQMRHRVHDVGVGPL